MINGLNEKVRNLSTPITDYYFLITHVKRGFISELMRKQSSSSRRREGFTLIELLVVITIIGFAIGIAIPSFSSFMKTRRLVEARKELKSTLKDAQSRALSSIDGFNWGVHLERGSNSFELFGSPNLTYSSATKKIPHQLVSGVVISDLSSQSGDRVNAVFSVLRGAVYFCADGVCDDKGNCLGGSEDSGCSAPRCLSIEIALQGSSQKSYIIVNERNIYESDTNSCP